MILTIVLANTISCFFIEFIVVKLIEHLYISCKMKNLRNKIKLNDEMEEGIKDITEKKNLEKIYLNDYHRANIYYQDE